MRLSALPFALLAACYDPIEIPEAEDATWRWFVIDGERKWEFESDDTTVPYRIVASKTAETTFDEGSDLPISTITFSYDCLSDSGECLADTDGDGVKDLEAQAGWTWQLSVLSSEGAFWHSFDDAIYAPPVQIATASQAIDEAVTTTSNGATFTSTRGDRELCDTKYWKEDNQPDACISWTIDDGGAGTPIAGTWQALYEYGFVSFRRAADGRLWRLRGYDVTR